MCGSLTDNGEARSGTVDLGCYLGVGSTYGVEHFQTSATGFTNIGTSTAVRGFTSRHQWPSDSGVLQTASLDSTGTYLASTTSSGATISASAPTHLVVFIRSTASASGAVFGNPRFLAIFGPQTTAL